jgi:hypothetical protein
MEFLTLCLPSSVDFGLPSDEKAFNQAIGVNTSKHSAVAYTLRNMGESVYEMRRADSRAARAMFNAEWVKTIVYISKGGELPESAAEIGEKPNRASKSEALAALAAIKAESCPEPVERIDTQDRLDISKIEAELLSGKVIERGGEWGLKASKKGSV